MKYLLLFLSFLPLDYAHAARGFRCETDDQAMLYHSTGRFADWGQRQVTQKCQELSQAPALCRFRGCRPVEIAEAQARASDRERASLDRQIRALEARHRPKLAARANSNAAAQAEARRRAYDSIDQVIRRKESIADHFQFGRLSDPLCYR